MPRRRLGVALVLEPPLADEVDGLRRALGDGSRSRIVPHLTLVSPINLAEADLGPALVLLRRAAASIPGPLELILGPPATFLPDNPVVYLRVAGDLAGLARVREVVAAGPLARAPSPAPVAEPTWPWVPHVTLAEAARSDRIPAALAALDAFEVAASFDRLVLLEQRHLPVPDTPRRWVPLADAAFGPRHVVGRGGLELELTWGTVVDPDAATLLGASDPRWWRPGEDQGGELAERRSPFPILCTARRAELVVGVGALWWSRWRGRLGVIVDPTCRGQGIGSQILAALESRLADAGWDGPPLEAIGPAEFYRGRSRTVSW